MEEANKEKLHKLLNCLVRLPRKIISLHEWENLPEFVLYELSGPECFNLNKSAYFVDNPDFNCFKGIAGFSMVENDLGIKNIWEEPDDFSNFMKLSGFNQKVRRVFINESIKDDFINKLSKELEIKNPFFYSWDMKHNNHGFLLFERNEKANGVEEYFIEGLHILGLCPIF